MDVDLAREFYFRELDGKANEDGRMGVYVALFSVLGGVLAYLLRSAWPAHSPWCWLAFISAVAAGVLYFVAVIFVLRAAAGFTYERLPLPDRILGYYEGLVAYYAANPSEAGSVENDFEDYLVRHYIGAASRNASNNLTRSARFYSAGRLLLWTVVLGAASVVLLAVNSI